MEPKDLKERIINNISEIDIDSNGSINILSLVYVPNEYEEDLESMLSIMKNFPLALGNRIAVGNNTENPEYHWIFFKESFNIKSQSMKSAIDAKVKNRKKINHRYKEYCKKMEELIRYLRIIPELKLVDLQKTYNKYEEVK
jgi:hypothetical protein